MPEQGGDRAFELLRRAMKAEGKVAPKELARPEDSEGELTMARTLVGAMVRDFQPQAYKKHGALVKAPRV